MGKLHIAFSAILFIVPFCFCATGTTHVRGQLLCHGKPAIGEKIELWEKNFGFPDNLIVSDVTDNQGFFMLRGSISDWVRKPIIYVYFVNYCEAAITKSFMICGNSVKVFIPPEFVADGNLPRHIFNLDNLELSKAITEQAGLERITHAVFSHKECRYIN
uniref:Transthyretin-like family protein n=1 Tax=Caenorhabditis tropicalis TaxID=1561998 RepID=A0A1I7V2U9_9PELO